MQSKIDTIDKLEEQLYLNANLMQKITSNSKVDSDIVSLIDEISQLQHSTISSIVEYLKNNK